MLSAICQSAPKVYNPTNNSLLEPEVRAHNFAKSAAWHNIAYTVSCVAILAISLGVAFYVAINFPVWAVLATGAAEMVAIKFIFQYFLSNLSNATERKTEAYLFEKEICELSDKIKRDAKESGRPIVEIRNRAKAMGAFTDFIDHPTLNIERYYKDNKPEAELSLTPLIARAERCHQEAVKKLKEIDQTFNSIPEGRNTNPYRAEIARLDDVDYNVGQEIKSVRQNVRKFEAIKATKRKEYLEWRMKEIFAAYVYRNPIHSGLMEDAGHLTEETDLFDYLLESREDVRDTLFAFSPYTKEITRNRFEKMERELLLNHMKYSLFKLKSRDGACIEITMADIDTSKTSGSSIQVVRDLLQENAGRIRTLEEFEKVVMENFYSLMAQDEIIAAIRPIVNMHYIKLFETYDISSGKNKHARILLHYSNIDKKRLPKQWTKLPTDINIKEDDPLLKKYVTQVNERLEELGDVGMSTLLSDGLFQVRAKAFMLERSLRED